jgi:MFS family permease
MLPRAAAFWLMAGVLFLLFFAAAAPSPLYGVYQARWRFSATTLTVVFAAYALLLLVTLLVFGSVSDYLGRRRVISVAMAAGAGACGLFLAAHGVGLLFAAPPRSRQHRLPPSWPAPRWPARASGRGSSWAPTAS